ncbi:VOC family protein [Paraburkholderia sp. J94]|uniref:VOC family protein n=1 Tax=Paraburkholderia sp. J94 TaxID=2805441 RepID=UPI002AB12C24|nr:VOC family protein [Paraburkholderia sp. J94]
MKLSITRLILYVRDVTLLESFYQSHFGLDVIERIPGEWVVLKAGSVEMALHRVGEPYRDHTGSGCQSNAKLVFHVPAGLADLRTKLIAANVRMREMKRYDGFPYVMCDGCDPEGNVFQLCQPD